MGSRASKELQVNPVHRVNGAPRVTQGLKDSRGELAWLDLQALPDLKGA